MSVRVLAATTARARNARGSNDALYDTCGCRPADGFTRAALFSGSIDVVDELLDDYGLPNGPTTGTLFHHRRERLARHICAMA